LAAFIDLILEQDIIVRFINSFQHRAVRYYLPHALNAPQIFHSLALHLIVVRKVIDVLLSFLCAAFYVIFNFFEIFCLLSDLLSQFMLILLFQYPRYFLVFLGQLLLLVVTVVILILDGLDSLRNSFVLLFDFLLQQVALSVFLQPDLFRVGFRKIILDFLLVSAVSL
jgi:hypothetical protein